MVLYYPNQESSLSNSALDTALNRVEGSRVMNVNDETYYPAP